MASQKERTIFTFIYPALDQDNSLKLLSPITRQKIEDALRTALGLVEPDEQKKVEEKPNDKG